MLQSIWRKLKSERGQALIEFAFVFPILLVFLLTLVDFGIALDRREVIQHAVREAARQGAVGASVSAIEDAAIDQSQGSFTAADIDVCYVDGPGGSPDFGRAGSFVRVSGEYTYEFAVGKEFLDFFGIGAPGISMTPHADARLETSVTGAAEC
jgi:hypothetical protein